MRAPRPLVVLLPFALVVACDQSACPTTTDGGVVDAGDPADIPDLDAGTLPVVVGDPCDPAGSTCPAGTVCVAGPLSSSVGVCRVACGTLTGGVVEKSGECPSGTSCQAPTDDVGEPVAVACLPQATARDALCHAWNDALACDREAIADAHGVPPSSVSCAITNGDARGPLYCKIGCDYAFDEECPSGERCLADATGDLWVEIGPDDDYVYCTVTSECSIGDGFACTPTDEGDICAKPAGTCALPVPIYSAGPVAYDEVCNVVDDHKACDDAAYRYTDGAAGVECDPVLGLPVCMAYCRYPGMDYDENGAIEDWELEESFSCRVDEECSDLHGIGVDTGGPCTCGEGSLCEADCGAGSSARCAQGACLATYGTCVKSADLAEPEPVPEPEPDVPADAGG